MYIYFYERAFNILKMDGLLCFITPNKWIQSNYGIELRKFISEKNIIELFDFGELNVFAEASTFPSIIIIANQTSINQKFSFHEISSINSFIEKKFSSQQIETVNLKAEKWILDNSKTSSLISKLESKFKPLGEIFNYSLFAGIKTGANEILIISEEILKQILNKNPNENVLFKNVCFGKDFKKYQDTIENNKHVFFPYEFDGKENKLIEIEKYPATLDYLLKHKDKLSNRAIIKEGIEKGSHKWYELQQINRYFNYANNKIIYPDIALDNRFFYDENGLFPDMTCFFIPTLLKEYVGLLNSTLFKYLASKYCPILGNINQGGRIRYKSTYLSKIPLPIISDQDDKTFLIEKATEIINNKRKEKDTTALEIEIDQLVYQLYELTPEEIEIIEKS